jgi:formylglycine-generating enzyme required for sulfatase activity
LRVEVKDLGEGDIKSIFREFYERTISNLPEAEHAPARRLVEDQLVKDGIRVPYAAQALLAQPGITQDLLDRLSNASLLRVQRDEAGRMIYEVGHDTLVGPIGEAAQARRAREEKERLQREADEQRREKEKAVVARRRARLVALGAIVLSLVAIAASFWAWRQTINAQEQTRIAEEKTLLAEQNQKKADDKTLEAEQNLKTAEENARLAEEKRLEVEQQKNATAEQKRKAEEEARRAREALREVEITTVKVVQGLFRDASVAILRLDYETARDRLHDAADLTAKMPFDNPLGRLRPAVADSLLEPAYFLTESGNAPGAMFEIGKIAQALAAHVPADTLKIDTRTPEGARYARSALRRILKNLRPAAFQAMEEKYYPVLLPVPGGTFNLAENYQVTLSDFRLARTETTVWQYNLYLAEQGKDIFDDKTISRPGWGWEGNNPIVNVSWFDACQYANWLSLRFGLRRAYEMGAVSESTFGDFYENIAIDTTANGFRLPTEAEWEFAARGGPQGLRDSFEFAGGNTMNRLGWYYENSGNRARAVAEWLPNQLGLYDMSGNVWEWCWNWFEGNPSEAQTNPAPSRVDRGGSWNGSAGSCRVSVRGGFYPVARSNNIGFRLASFPQ